MGRSWHLPEASMRSVNIWRCIGDRRFPENRSMSRYMAMIRKAAALRLQSISRIYGQNVRDLDLRRLRQSGGSDTDGNRNEKQREKR